MLSIPTLHFPSSHRYVAWLQHSSPFHIGTVNPSFALSLSTQVYQIPPVDCLPVYLYIFPPGEFSNLSASVSASPSHESSPSPLRLFWEPSPRVSQRLTRISCLLLKRWALNLRGSSCTAATYRLRGCLSWWMPWAAQQGTYCLEEFLKKLREAHSYNQTF